MSRKKHLLERNAAMMADRARGLTIREIAARHGLRKSRAHAIVRDIPVLPPAPITRHELVRLPAGGYTYRITTMTPHRSRAYWVRDGRRRYPGDKKT